MSTTFARIDRGSLTLGGLMLVLGAAAAVIGGATSINAEFAHSYFYGYLFWFCLTLGCFGLTLLHHCARGHWGFPVVRLFEAGGGPVAWLVMVIGFVPVYLGRAHLYEWMDPAVVAKDPMLQHKAVYLNEPFWLARVALYFLSFILVSHLMKTWLRKEEQTGDLRWRSKRTNLASGFLPIFVLLANFLFTDWVMSQEPHWYSTIFGVWFVVGSALAALALVSIILGFNSKKAPYDQVVGPWLTKDLGNLMLAFTMLWAYFSFSQYLIIWSGNLPEFTVYFAKRSFGGWWVLGTALTVLHFFVPFLLLLAPRTKRVPAIFGTTALYIFLMRVADQFFVVVPAHRGDFAVRPMDIGFLLLWGGIWLIQFGTSLKSAPLLTHRDTEVATEAPAHA